MNDIVLLLTLLVVFKPLTSCYAYTFLQVVKVLKETEDHNSRLRTYIDGLLVVIMEKHPDILEKRL